MQIIQHRRALHQIPELDRDLPETLALSLIHISMCIRDRLKERSPSCGCGQIYDGTFSKTLVEGDGMAAQMLKKHGLTVYGESQIGELVNTRPFFYSI